MDRVSVCWLQSRVEAGVRRTFDLDGYDVATGLHHAAEQDGHVGDVALSEDWGVLDQIALALSHIRTSSSHISR